LHEWILVEKQLSKIVLLSVAPVNMSAKRGPVRFYQLIGNQTCPPSFSKGAFLSLALHCACERFGNRCEREKTELEQKRSVVQNRGQVDNKMQGCQTIDTKG
jgi:hypothetical protein